MSASKIALTLAAAGVFAVGFTVYQSHQADAARAELVPLQREQTALRERRTALERDLRTAEQTRLAAAVAPMTTGNTGESSAADRAQQQRELDRYLANHPELSRLRREAYKLSIKADSLAYLRNIGVSDQQIDQMAALDAQGDDRRRIAAANGQTPAVESNANRKTVAGPRDTPAWQVLAPVLGEAAAERWIQNTTSGMRMATEMVNHVASAQFFKDEPFTLDQADQLAAIISRHFSGRFPSPRVAQHYPQWGSISWDNVLRDAEPILSGQQMDSLRAWAARGQNIALMAAVEKQSSAKGDK